MFRHASPLTLAALTAWVTTAAFGGNLLLRGKAYRLFLHAVSPRTLTGPRRPILRAALMGLHFLGAVSGLILWIAYSLSGREVLADGALILLGAVALLGDQRRGPLARLRPTCPAAGRRARIPRMVGHRPCDGSHHHRRPCRPHHLAARGQVTPADRRGSGLPMADAEAAARGTLAIGSGTSMRSTAWPRST
jgi:hypothetical protein